LRIGYVTHKLCAQGKWDSVKKELIETHHKSKAKAANIKTFEEYHLAVKYGLTDWIINKAR